MRRLVPMLVLFAVWGLPATADAPDPRGWTTGTPAAGAARLLAPEPGPEIALPATVADHLGALTLLVYFSPTCGHCQAVQPEIGALATRAGSRLTVIGIATGHAREADIEAFKTTFAVPYRVVHDRDGAVAEVMEVRSTPSALLVRKQGKVVRIVDGWYPYAPGFDHLVELWSNETPFALFERGRYLGTATCGACHTHEAEAWQLTHHSVAWRTLVSRSEHENPKCTSCHVVGAGQGGWDGSPTSTLVDVGCEACHGPGGPHDGERVDARTTCVGCHDADHSIAFTVDKGMPGIDHYRGTTLDDEAYMAARRALFDGTAPRDLLAFPDADRVGAAACKECHAPEYASWAATPHAGAFQTLKTEAAAKHRADAALVTECVRCHATQAVAGKAPPTVGGYHTAEGVGCESCHGPGGAHVAAKGAPGTIQGLGESCPVCVIESLCTSCHTPQWDPTWQLDARLPLVGHGRP